MVACVIFNRILQTSYPAMNYSSLVRFRCIIFSGFKSRELLEFLSFIFKHLTHNAHRRLCLTFRLEAVVVVEVSRLFTFWLREVWCDM